MDNLCMDNVGSLHFPEEPHCPRCCPASIALAPAADGYQVLWKSFRNHPDQRSESRPKVIGLKSESVIEFIPES